MRQFFQRPRHRVRADAFRSVSKILSLEPGGLDLSQYEESDPFWVDFADVAMDHLVVPALADRVEKQGLGEHFPALISRHLDAMLRLNRSRNVQLREEALDIADALNEIGIVPVFLKGSAGLLTGLYDEPGIRIMSDLDVLLPLDLAGQCLHHLTGLGFQRVAMIRHPRNKCVDTFTRGSSIAPIDVHHQVLDYEYQKILSTREVMQDCVTHRWHHVEFAVPSITHQVVINIGHAQLNDHGYWFGNLPLRLLHDLTCLQKKAPEQIDWQRVETAFTTTRNRRALEFHLLAARNLLGFETGTDVRPRLLTRLLFWRSISLMGFPSLQRISFRFIRVFLLLSRELSAAELRSRLRRNMADPVWWQRQFAIFWKGTRGN